MTGARQHHVHEARAPQPAAAGGIAADVAPRLRDQARPAEAAAKALGLEASSREARCTVTAPRIVADAICMAHSRVMPRMVGVMDVGMVVAVGAVMRSCRSRRGERDKRQ